MDGTWREFLSSRGAVFENGVAAHFGDPAAEAQAAARGDALMELSWIGFIRAEGADAEAFLHGQFTNDLKALEEGRWQLTAYCNPKGRVLALMRVVRAGGGFLLELPAERIEPIVQRLRIYVLRSAVRLAPESFACFGVAGAGAVRAFGETFGALPAEAPEAVLHRDGMLVRRTPGLVPRVLVAGAPQRLSALWRALESRATPAGADRWRWLDIVSGLPNVYTASAELFVPQSLNLDLLGGVSFTKGCYPGQEIVARLHHRGRTKHRLLRARVETDAAPRPGDKLYAAAFGDQAAGHVVDAARAPEGGFDLLAAAPVDEAVRRELRWLSPDGPALAFGESGGG